MAHDQVSYDMQTLWKLQHATTELDAGAATLPTFTPRSDVPISSNIRRTPVGCSNIRHTVVSFPFHYLRKRPDRLLSYRFSLAMVGLVQSLITSWMVSCQTTPNCCLLFGDNYTGCYLDQHLPKLRWWVLKVRSYGPKNSSWNLLAYSGLQEFFIREESSSKETRLGWTQPGKVYQM